MVSALLNEQGYGFDVIEIQLTHVSNNAVRAAYNRAQYWEKRVKMMQERADYRTHSVLRINCSSLDLI